VWTALSRAVRAPSRVDREFTQPGLAGGPNFESEISDVLEIGYRAQPSARLSFSATGFRHEHQRLLTQRVLPGGVFFTNDREGRTAGVEAWGSYRPADWVRLGGGFVRQHQAFRIAPGVVEIAQAQRDPNGWWKANAAFNLGASSDLDFHVRHYDALPNNAVQDYTAVDMRFAWRARPNVELSLLIQNLLDPRHVEWSPGAQLERGAYVKMRIDL
jgi:iron complex outermembrane receptor protein